MRSSTPHDLAGHCERCLLPLLYCLCADIPSIETRCRFLILRHHCENALTSNTGRLAALAVPRCQLVSYGDKHSPRDWSALIPADAWLLYPDTDAGPVTPEPDALFVVLDATWTQARRMTHRMPELRKLRRLSLPVPATPWRMRQPTVEQGMSTLEAVAQAVRFAESVPKGDRLQQLYELRVQRSCQMRGLPYPPRVS